MKYFKKFIYVGIFFLLIGVPIYAAGRIIFPNLLKERIVNSLPAGSTLSISNIYSDTDLTINYEEVSFSDQRKKYNIFFPKISIKPKVSLDKPLTIIAPEASISTDNLSLQLNSLEITLEFGKLLYKSPELSIQINKLVEKELLAANNIIMLFEGIGTPEKLLSVNASEFALNYKSPKGLVKINSENFDLKGNINSNLDFFVKTDRSVVNLSLVEPRNDDRIIIANKSDLSINLSKGVKWLAPFKLNLATLSNPTSNLFQHISISGNWEWSENSKNCDLIAIIQINQQCGKVQNLKNLQFKLDDTKGNISINGDGICITPNAGCPQKITAVVKSKNTAEIFSKVMSTGLVNPLLGGVVLAGLLSNNKNGNDDYDNKVKFEMYGSKILINDKSIF
jgi:hypothetical protein